MSSNKKKKEIESQKYENESKQLSKNKPVKKKKLRCATCNKKLGLLGFECKCGMLFWTNGLSLNVIIYDLYPYTPEKYDHSNEHDIDLW